MKTIDDVYAFLKKHYKPSRFEESPDCRDFPNYCKEIAQDCLSSLMGNGYDLISRYESKTGEDVCFDRELNIISDEKFVELSDPEYSDVSEWLEDRAMHGGIR